MPKKSIFNTSHCIICGGRLTGYAKKYCQEKRCQAVRKERELARKKKVSKALSEKHRAASLKEHPRYCDNCGRAFTIVDNLKLPVCSREACATWWSGAKDKRKRELQKKYRKEKRYTTRKHGSKVESVTGYPIGTWNHASYVKEQKEAKKPNGRGLCVGCHKVELVGDEKFRCPTCLHRADDWMSEAGFEGGQTRVFRPKGG